MEEKLGARVDADASLVPFMTCSQTLSPPHVGRQVSLEQPIPLLNAFAYLFYLFSCVRLMTASPLALILLLFSLFFLPSSNSSTVSLIHVFLLY